MHWSVLRFIVFLIPLTASGQWVPVTADETIVVQHFDTYHALLSTTTTRGRYLRSSKGDVVYQILGPAGKPRRGTLVSYNGKRGIYEIDYMSGKAREQLRRVVQQRLRTSEDELTPREQSRVLGHDQLSGLRCVVEPMYRVGPNRTRVPMGRSCFVPQLNFLMIKQDYTKPNPNSGTDHYLITLTNIDTGREPDAAEFSKDRATILNHWLATYGARHSSSLK